MIADEAARLWGGASAPPRLIAHRENEIYDVTLPSGRAALRLHRPGYRSASEIISELHWMEELAKVGFPCPRPVRSAANALLHPIPDGRLATVIAWVEGEPLGSGTEPASGTEAERKVRAAEVGALLARLHDVTDRLDLAPDMDRPNWSLDGLTGPDPVWGRFWLHPSLSRSEVALLIRARDLARVRLTGLPAPDYGLIHADALRENVFRTPSGLALIDFDDSGFGHRMFDLAVSLSQSLDEPDYPALTEALMDGYAARRPIPDRSLFGVFAMLRAFASVGWMIPRVPQDHPKTAIYIARALRLAAAFPGV